MKKLIVSSKKLRDVPDKFVPEVHANRILLDAGFEDGKVAYAHYSEGKLSVVVCSRKLHNKIKNYG